MRGRSRDTRSNIHNKHVIAVFGFEQGAGVTSLCMAIAAMASSGKVKRVHVFEMGQQHTFTKIRRFYGEKMLSTDGTFQIDKIMFYPNAERETVLEWIAKDEVFVVLDCGDKAGDYQDMLKLCTRKILLCSLLPWKIHRVQWMLSHGGQENEWDCALVTSGKGYEQQEIIRKTTGYTMIPWHFIEDPLKLTKHSLEELYQLIYGKKYITR